MARAKCTCKFRGDGLEKQCPRAPENKAPWPADRVRRARPRRFTAGGSAGRAALLALSCLLATAGRLRAQTGSLRGQVSDPSGAVVSHATVATTPAQPGASRTAFTDVNGQYVFQGLAPGAYTVTAEAPGFAEFSQREVRIPAGKTVTLDLKLELLTVHQQVEVQAQPVRVSIAPQENASAVVIKGSDLRSLSDDPDTLLSQLQELAGPSVGASAAEIYIDGFTGGDLPPKSAIREVRVNQDPFSAAYDRLGYGRIEILTKPGSEDFHGGLSLQGNTAALNSRDPFLAGRKQPPFHSLLYGGRLGGPLGKKASFFFSGESRNITHGSLINAEVLDPSFQPQSYVAAVPNPWSLTSLSPRLDVQLSANNTLSARYDYYGTSETNDGIGTQSLPSQGYEFDRRHHLLQVSDTQVLGPRVVNETRFQYLHFNNTRLPGSFAPTLEVLGAFTGGGSSAGMLSRSESHYEAQNLTSLTLGPHYVQFGGFLRDIRRTENTNANFNGTFIFNSLNDYQTTEQDLSQGMSIAEIQAAGAGPSQFDLTTGNPVAGVNRLDGALYVQDDWKVRPNFTASYGLRFESENVISDHADWAPRLGLAWGLGHGPNTKTVLRAGFGIFYDRFDDDQMIVAARLNGSNQLSYVVRNPAFFPNVPSLAELAAGSATAPTTYLISPTLRSPYELETAVSVERQVAQDITFSLTYLHSHGEHRFLTNDVNAPLPGSYSPADPSSGVRPLATLGNIYEYESAGIFRQTQLITNFTIRQRFLSLFGYYTFNDAHSDTAGVNSFPANPWNILADYGRASYGVRHRLFLGGSLALPWGIELDPMLVARSGWPFSITLGEDLYGTGIHNGRPAFATAATLPADLRVTPYGNFNIHPAPGEALIPPNTESGPSALAFNLRASFTLGFGTRTQETHAAGGLEEHHHHHHGGLGSRGLSGGGPEIGHAGTDRRYALTFSVSARNLLNNVNLWEPVGNLNSPLFGRSLELTGGPYSGEGGANRRIDLRISLDF
jgi:Carboxypeptidase regulatory-like domain